MAMFCLVILPLLLTLCGVNSLDNGLGLTPPMGWLSWERFECNTDCKNYPNDCISEKLYMDMADMMVSEGYRDVGYEYVNIDDCWSAKERTKDGRLIADPVRFPSGIKKLADYVHSKGLKLGIYGDFGHATCGGYPGSEFYMQEDAETFAAWGVDSLKMDGCNANLADYNIGYPIMGFNLNQTGRPILYSCSWPDYLKEKEDPKYANVAKHCNLWRVWDDIYDSWGSVLGIINYFGADKYHFTEVAGPGQFNDPDMLIIGNFGLSYDQQRVQMALWSIMAAPLYMSNDLRKIPNESKALLQNKNLIAINQDPIGVQGRRIAVRGALQVWTRPLTPQGVSKSPRVAFALLNTGSTGSPAKVTFELQGFNATSPGGYKVIEAFTGETMGFYKPNATIVVHVNPSGVFMGVASPIN